MGQLWTQVQAKFGKVSTWLSYKPVTHSSVFLLPKWSIIQIIECTCTNVRSQYGYIKILSKFVKHSSMFVLLRRIKQDDISISINKMHSGTCVQWRPRHLHTLRNSAFDAVRKENGNHLNVLLAFCLQPLKIWHLEFTLGLSNGAYWMRHLWLLQTFTVPKLKQWSWRSCQTRTWHVIFCSK